MDSSNNIDSLFLEYNLPNEDLHEMKADIEVDTTKLSIQTIDYISKVLGISPVIHTTPIENGSVIRILKLLIMEDGNNNVFLTYIVILIYNYILFQHEELTVSEILRKENDNREVIKEILDKYGITDNKLHQIFSAVQLKEKRNNYFKILKSYTDIQSITINYGSNYNFENDFKCNIPYKNFNDYSINIEKKEITIDQVKVDIIKPVLQKGNNSSWGGIFDDRIISFKMLSNEFKTKSQIGDVDFKAGCYILCKLSYKEAHNEVGGLVMKDIKVISVYDYCNDGVITKTLEGKKKEAEKLQQSFKFEDYKE